MSEWISVKDKVPENKEQYGEYVLTWYGGPLRGCIIAQWDFIPGSNRDGFTHWMPLPPPPLDSTT